MLCHITMWLLYIQNSCQARALSHFALFTVTLNHQKERRRKKKHRERNPSQAGGRDSFNVIILASDMMVLWTILT